MKCPHCLVEINPAYREFPTIPDKYYMNWIYTMVCPNVACGRVLIDLVTKSLAGSSGIVGRTNIWPLTSSRPPVAPEVDPPFSNDYKEACLILMFSPKASAALSRRCLQGILREKAGVRKSDLSKEIDQIIEGRSLPSHLSESIDAIRNIGNFAAHPLKSSATGEIVEVEPGEAEWLLDVLEALFDFYFVQPALLQAKRDALNRKLADIGKPPMK